MLQRKNIDNLPDRISDFYEAKTIFITGGSGFVGKVLIEKFLRECSNIQTIYLLVRNKKEKTANERLTDIFKDVLFGQLKEKHSDLFKKCKAIIGDISESNLGISVQDKKILTEEVDIIYHCAATTKFDDTLKYATTINTRGTKFMLDLAKECKHLEVFVHVSTAYVCPKEEIVLEKLYEPPADPHEVLNSINWITDEIFKNNHNEFLGDCPNTYTFSKSLAEALVADEFENLPVIIIRPSLVIPIMLEPVKGWCNNLQGPMGLLVGAGKGIIRSMYMNSNCHADMIPADVCIRAMMVATWSYATYKQDRIYNVVSSKTYNITWDEIINIGKEAIYTKIPFNGILWYPGGSMKKSKLIHLICFYLFQILPAILLDGLLMFLGYKPVLYHLQRRIQKGGDMFEFYTWKAWYFDNKKTLGLRKILNERELSKYDIPFCVNLHAYFVDCVYFVRRHILKESDDMIPIAKRNMKIMWYLDALSKILLTFVLFYYFFTLFIIGN